MKIKHYLKQFWYFIWEDNSIWSWFANIIIAFILIKYLIFPFMGFVLGSEFPVVAVVSTSMQHRGSFDSWWSTQEAFYGEFDIKKQDFENFVFKDGLDKGDVIVLFSPKHLVLGDVLVFLAKDKRPIIHRVIDLDPIQTKGDNNNGQIMTDVLNEKDVSREYFIGKAGLRIPWIGYIKIAFAGVLSLFGLQVS